MRGNVRHGHGFGPPPARPPARRMELSAIGEQVFAVESIRKKRVRKVGSSGAGRGGGSARGHPPPLPPGAHQEGGRRWGRARGRRSPSPQARGRGWRAGTHVLLVRWCGAEGRLSLLGFSLSAGWVLLTPNGRAQTGEGLGKLP